MKSKSTHAVLFIALAHLTIELCENYLPVIYPTLRETLNLSYTQVGTITFVLSAATTLPQPFSGYLSDRWRPHQLVAVSVVWIGLTMGLVGFTWSYPSLLAIVALGGLGSALFHPPSAVVASAGGGEHKGAAMSIFSVSGNLGSAFSPLLMTAGIGALGLLGTSMLIPLGLLVGSFLYLQAGRISRTQADDANARTRLAENGSLAGLVLIVMVVMARSWFQLTLMTYLPTWIESQGGSVVAGGRMLFLLLLGVGAGSLVGGALSDRIGRWQVLVVSLTLLGPAYWLFMGQLGLMQTALVAIMGFLVGTSFPVALVMAQETWPRSVGVASGLVIGLGWLPGGLGASATGFIADQFSLATGLQTLIVAPILGAVCGVAYAMVLRREKEAKTQAVTLDT